MKNKKRNKKYTGKYAKGNTLPYFMQCIPMSEEEKNGVYGRPLVSAQLLTEGKYTESALGDIGCVLTTMVELNKKFVENDQLKALVKDAQIAFCRIVDALSNNKEYDLPDAEKIKEVIQIYSEQVDLVSRKDVWDCLITARERWNKLKGDWNKIMR